MTRSIRGTRRAVLLMAGMGAATTLLLSGCGTGQIAETAHKVPSVPGVNVDSRDGAVSIRNLMVAYAGVKGYPAGADAPLIVALVNNAETPVTVTVTAAAPAGGPQDTVVSGTSVVLAGKTAPTSAPSPTATASPTASASASPSPTASASASASESASPTAPSPTAPSPSASAEPPTGTPAAIEIPAKGSVMFTAESTELLKVVGLSAPLTPGKSVNLTFAFSSNNEQLTVTAPVGVPLTAAPRATPQQNEGGEGGVG